MCIRDRTISYLILLIIQDCPTFILMIWPRFVSGRLLRSAKLQTEPFCHQLSRLINQQYSVAKGHKNCVKTGGGVCLSLSLPNVFSIELEFSCTVSTEFSTHLVRIKLTFLQVAVNKLTLFCYRSVHQFYCYPTT